MSGFDDLLSSSSRPFEENPFANPFEKPRSNSPDPWSSYGHQHEQPFQGEDYASPFGSGFPSATDDASHTLTEELDERHKENTLRLDHDVVQAEVENEGEVAQEATAESDEHHPEAAKSPGFRESVEPEHDESDESAPPQSKEDGPSKPYTPSFDSLQDRSRASSSSSPAKTPVGSATTLSPERSPGHNFSSLPSPPASQTNTFVSPLEQSTSALHTFASLSLGGASFGGWQDEHEHEHDHGSALASAATAAEDDTQQDMAIDENNVQRSLAEVKENTIEDPDQAPRDSREQPLFQVSVDDPQKVGDPIRPYILYTVHTKTSSPLYSKSTFSVLRRYSDFLWLYETLSYTNPGVIVPPVPEKTAFGRFANLFVQQRRLALEICIQKIANHPVLAKDPDLKLFLESDSFALDIKHRKSDANSGLLSSLGQSLSGPRFFEVDEWFDKKKAYLDGLESQLKGLVKMIDLVSKQRADMAISIGEFSASIGELSESDLNPQLKAALKHLSDVEKKSQDLQHMQAQEDAMTFMATAEEYSRVINSVRLAFASRVRCHRLWQTAESEARRVKQGYEAAKAQGRAPDRGSMSLTHVADAERKAAEGRHDFEKCSKLVKMELARFEEDRVKDFKVSLERFLEGMIDRQKELIATWEAYQNHLLNKARQHATDRDGSVDGVAVG